MIRHTFVAALGALSLCGCTLGPRYAKPDLPTPASLIPSTPSPPASPLSRVSEADVDLTDWWSQFQDPTLNRLIGEARAGNLDRQTAASRVRQARAAAEVSRAAMFPSITGNASYYRLRLGQNAIPSSLKSSFGGGASGAGASGGGAAGGGGQSSSFQTINSDIYILGLQGSYAPDLFGSARSTYRASREREEAQVWSARDTDVTVTSEVARAYFDLRASQARLSVLQANARSQKTLLDMLAARSKGGLVNEVDKVQQRSQLALTTSQVPPVETQLASDMHQLALLLGLTPDAVAGELAPRPDPMASLPALPSNVPIGLPSSLLKRRPDIRQAERQLAASVSDVDQATAALYPQIQLTGVADLVSASLANLLEGGSGTLLGGVSLMQPLFDGGKLRAQRRQTQEQAVQAGIAYRLSVLTAFQQTADALVRYDDDQRQVVALRAGDADARRALDLDRAQYFGGLSDITATLRAEAAELQTQDQLAQAEGQLFADLVDLYRSLGGGWSLAASGSGQAEGAIAASADQTGERPSRSAP